MTRQPDPVRLVPAPAQQPQQPQLPLLQPGGSWLHAAASAASSEEGLAQWQRQDQEARRSVERTRPPTNAAPRMQQASGLAAVRAPSPLQNESHGSGYGRWRNSASPTAAATAVQQRRGSGGDDGDEALMLYAEPSPLLPLSRQQSGGGPVDSPSRMQQQQRRRHEGPVERLVLEEDSAGLSPRRSGSPTGPPMSRVGSTSKQLDAGSGGSRSGSGSPVPVPVPAGRPPRARNTVHQGPGGDEHGGAEGGGEVLRLVSSVPTPMGGPSSVGSSSSSRMQAAPSSPLTSNRRPPGGSAASGGPTSSGSVARLGGRGPSPAGSHATASSQGASEGDGNWLEEDWDSSDSEGGASRQRPPPPSRPQQQQQQQGRSSGRTSGPEGAAVVSGQPGRMGSPPVPLVGGSSNNGGFKGVSMGAQPQQRSVQEDSGGSGSDDDDWDSDEDSTGAAAKAPAPPLPPPQQQWQQSQSQRKPEPRATASAAAAATAAVSALHLREQEGGGHSKGALPDSSACLDEDWDDEEEEK